jgi:hypothetical protein
VDPSQQYEVRLKSVPCTLTRSCLLTFKAQLWLDKEEQERLWKSIILAKVEGYAEFCGLVIRSVTSPLNFHLVFNLHSFAGTVLMNVPLLIFKMVIVVVIHSQGSLRQVIHYKLN